MVTDAARRPRAAGKILAALALLALLWGCVVYLPGSGGPRYHNWR